jgi:hypothetical protein
MTKHATRWAIAILLIAAPSIVVVTAKSFAGDAAPAPDAVQVTGKITAVTVYQGQALVTREIDIPAGQGLRELVVTDLPDHVLPTSIYAEPVDGAVVRSVRYRVRPVQDDIREEVRELDAQMQTVQDEINAAAAGQQVLDGRLPYLTNLESFTAESAKKELSEGVLDTETITELSRFMFEQHEEISARKLEIAVQLRELNQRMQLLQRERQTLSGGSAKTVREAVVFVNAPGDGAGRLRLRYLVDRANWTPSYAVRAAEDESGVNVEYYANVEQLSGENWTDVDMTLSTASPSLVAKSPTLDPLSITLGPAMPALSDSSSDQQMNYKVAREQLGRQRQELSQIRNSAGPLDAARRGIAGTDGDSYGNGYPLGAAGNGPARSELELSESLADEPQQQASQSGRYFLPTEQLAELQRRSDIALNTLASEEQLLDLTSHDRLQREPNGSGTSTEGVSVSYHMPNLTSLPSRSDRQLIQIASVPLEGDFYRLATPVLTSYVYREAELVNSSQLVLLAGPASTFVGDQFVGRGEIPTVAVGESFRVGLGIDAALRVTRELVTKTEQIQGGNRLVDFTYELALENFGSEAVGVRLLDRLPKPMGSDMKLTLQSTDEEVSDDAKYRISQFKEGIYRWDVEVPAQAFGLQRYAMKYTMKLEYDKELEIASLPAGR